MEIVWIEWQAVDYEEDGLTLKHRMVEVGRNSCRSSDQTPLLKQGHLEMDAYICDKMAF